MNKFTKEEIEKFATPQRVNQINEFFFEPDFQIENQTEEIKRLELIIKEKESEFYDLGILKNDLDRQLHDTKSKMENLFYEIVDLKKSQDAFNEDGTDIIGRCFLSHNKPIMIYKILQVRPNHFLVESIQTDFDFYYKIETQTKEMDMKMTPYPSKLYQELKLKLLGLSD